MWRALTASEFRGICRRAERPAAELYAPLGRRPLPAWASFYTDKTGRGRLPFEDERRAFAFLCESLFSELIFDCLQGKITEGEPFHRQVLPCETEAAETGFLTLLTYFDDVKFYMRDPSLLFFSAARAKASLFEAARRAREEGRCDPLSAELLRLAAERNADDAGQIEVASGAFASKLRDLVKQSEAGGKHYFLFASEASGEGGREILPTGKEAAEPLSSTFSRWSPPPLFAPRTCASVSEAFPDALRRNKLLLAKEFSADFSWFCSVFSFPESVAEEHLLVAETEEQSGRLRLRNLYFMYGGRSERDRRTSVSYESDPSGTDGPRQRKKI